MILGEDMIGLINSTNDTIIEDTCGHLGTKVFDSLILNSFKMENDLFKMFCVGDEYRCELIYRASRDGFEASSFHAKCDNKPATYTIIRTTNGCIFGAFTSVAWDSKSGFKADPDEAFIFSLVNLDAKPVYFRVKDNDKQSIFCKAHLGPTFGNGHDIMICNNSNTSTESFSDLGSSYMLELAHFDYGSAKAQSFLAGTRNFQTAEIEVFTCTRVSEKK